MAGDLYKCTLCGAKTRSSCGLRIKGTCGQCNNGAMVRATDPTFAVRIVEPRAEMFTRQQLDAAVRDAVAAEQRRCLADIEQVKRNLSILRMVWSVSDITSACEHAIRARAGQQEKGNT